MQYRDRDRDRDRQVLCFHFVLLNLRAPRGAAVRSMLCTVSCKGTHAKTRPTLNNGDADADARRRHAFVSNFVLFSPSPSLSPSPFFLTFLHLVSKSIFTTRSFLWRIHFLQKYIRLNYGLSVTPSQYYRATTLITIRALSLPPDQT
jgi:hypothetical protein